MSEFLRPLTMKTEEGEPYTRSPAVEQQIVESLGWNDADVLERYKSLSNEALMYNVRRFRDRDDYISGTLLREVGKRTVNIVKSTIKGVDPLGKQDVAMQVEMEILELAIAPQPSRKSEFLEVAFTAAVKRRTINLREQFAGTVEGHRGRYKPTPMQDLDEEDKKRKRPLEFAPDSRNSPESALLAFQDEQFREQAYEMVRAALEAEDERLMLMFRLYVVDRWPAWSPDPKVVTIASHFGLTRGQAKYMLEKIKKIKAEVLSAYHAGRKPAAAGGQR